MSSRESGVPRGSRANAAGSSHSGSRTRRLSVASRAGARFGKSSPPEMNPLSATSAVSRSSPEIGPSRRSSRASSKSGSSALGSPCDAGPRPRRTNRREGGEEDADRAAARGLVLDGRDRAAEQGQRFGADGGGQARVLRRGRQRVERRRLGTRLLPRDAVLKSVESVQLLRDGGAVVAQDRGRIGRAARRRGRADERRLESRGFRGGHVRRRGGRGDHRPILLRRTAFKTSASRARPRCRTCG